MVVDLDTKDLAKYPFLKEAQSLVGSEVQSLESFLKSNTGKMTASKAADRVLEAVSPPYRFEEINLEFPEIEILSYAIARIIASAMGERPVIERLAQYEAARAAYFLDTEDIQKRRYVAESVGINPEAESIDVRKYVELIVHLRDPSWRLVNRTIHDGAVLVRSEEIKDLIRERIRSVLRSQMPRPVPGDIRELLLPAIEKVGAVYQERMLEQFGKVEEGAFPPCMRALISAVSEGVNLPHTGRFAMTAFLHMIGMDTTQIVEVYQRAPDFDLSMTLYQVEHISGSSGTEYTPPGCATMRTYGLCVNRDSTCEKVSHPLSYYRLKKKQTTARQKKD